MSVNEKIIYLKIEFKRFGKVLAGSALGLGLMILLTGAVCLAFSVMAGKAGVWNRLSVGVVVPDGSFTTNAAVTMLSNMESVSSVSSFVQMRDEDEAVERFMADEFQILLVLPENFYDDITTGVNTPVRMYVPKHGTFREDLFRQLIESGVTLIEAEQSGLYAMLDTADYAQVEIDRNEMGNTLAAMYIEMIFDREDYFESLVLSPFGQMTYSSFYFITACICIMLLTGLFFPFMYDRQLSAVEEKLVIYGIGGFYRMAVRIGLMCAWFWAEFAVIYTGAGIISKAADLRFLSLRPAVYAVGALVALAVAVLCDVIYSWNRVLFSGRGVFAFLAAALAFVMCSGLIVPTVWLPQAVGSVGKALPTAHWANLFAATMYRGTDLLQRQIGRELGLTVLWILLGIGLGVTAQWLDSCVASKSR